MDSQVPKRGIKKPKKSRQKNRRFLANAKGFGKRGIFGRGTEIDQDDFSYYIHLMDAMKAGFEDEDEKVSMANNAFERTKGQEIHLASNQVVCKVLESLIGFVAAEHLERFFETLSESFRPVCSNRFASHVLQKMVEIAFLRSVTKESSITDNAMICAAVQPNKRPKVLLPDEESYNLDKEFSKEHKQNCCLFVEKVSKFLLNNLEDFVSDVCANHIMRTCIYSLSGLYVLKVPFEKSSAALPKNWKLYKVSESWWEIMKEFPQRLQMWPHFSDFPYSDHSSALLSVICISLKIVDMKLLKDFGKKLLEAFLKVGGNRTEKDKAIILDTEQDNNNVEHEEKEREDENDQQVINKNDVELPKVFEYQPAIVLLETLLTISGPKLFKKFHDKLFFGRLAILAGNQLTNFSVQKLLQNVKEKEDFESMFNELFDQIDSLLQKGYTGIVEALAAACLRLSTNQSKMIVALQRALHFTDDKEKQKHFFECITKLKPYEIIRDDTSTFVHLHGSLIVQHILKFNKPILLVNCILETSADKLASMFSLPNGSYIADAFLESKFIGEKSRERFIRLLEGYYVDLAITKFGSRILEKCFAAAQETQKIRIVKELASKCYKLKSTPYGHHISTSLRVDTYYLTPTQWKTSLCQQKNKADLLFKEIMN